MPLTTARSSAIADGMRELLRNIGTNIRIPKGKGNKCAIAWNLYRTYILQSYATAMYNDAKKDALKAGVLFDHEKNPMEPGTKARIYDDTIVCVDVEVRSPYEQIDAKKMAAFLSGRGVPQADLDAALKFASSMTKAPHVFRAGLITSTSV